MPLIVKVLSQLEKHAKNLTQNHHELVPICKRRPIKRLAATNPITSKLNIACLKILTFSECCMAKVHVLKKMVNMEKIEDNVTVHAYIGKLKVNGPHSLLINADGCQAAIGFMN